MNSTRSGRSGVGHRRFPVHNERERIAQDCYAGIGFDRVNGDMPPEGACPRHAMEQPEHMPRHPMQPGALRQLTLDIREIRFEGLLRIGEGLVPAEQHRIRRKQPPRLLIGGTAHHDAVDMIEMIARRLDRADPAIDRNMQIGMRRLQPVDAIVIERRNIAVLARRQTLAARPCGHARSSASTPAALTAAVSVSSATSGS